MRSKSPLTLMEQLVMLLVFALAAALCLKCFVWAERTGRETADRDAAAVQAQNAAELLKHTGGDLSRAAEQAGWTDGKLWQIGYDENWQQTRQEEAYLLQAELLEDGVPRLGSAEIRVVRGDGSVLCALPVCWQEVSP